MSFNIARLFHQKCSAVKIALCFISRLNLVGSHFLSEDSNRVRLKDIAKNLAVSIQLNLPLFVL